MNKLKIFQSRKDRLHLGISGLYPQVVIETTKEKKEKHHPINESQTRPWLKHYFLMPVLRETNGTDDILARDNNLIDIFKTTLPLKENSFAESILSSWRLFLDSTFHDSETPWYSGIRKVLQAERFYNILEQLELEMPSSNIQRTYQFVDHMRTQRKIPRIPIKLFFSLPGNEKEKLIEILRQALKSNPHNLDIALLAYTFFKAWNRTNEFLQLVRQENRRELEEWYYWVENDMKTLGTSKRAGGNSMTTFFIYDRASLSADEYKEAADWFMKENEFKCAYHCYYKAKEFETALELLQNISTKEFAELTNLRRISKGEKPLDLLTDATQYSVIYQEEMETLRGFARIKAAESYKQLALKARHHFDRETIETKYAFGELSEDEYQRLMRQLQERKQ